MNGSKKRARFVMDFERKFKIAGMVINLFASINRCFTISLRSGACLTMKNVRLSAKIAALIGTAALSFNAFAAPVDSGVLNIAVTNTIDGVYLNVVTGATGTSGGTTVGWDVNPYNNGAGFTWFAPGSVAGFPRGVGSTTGATGGVAVRLNPGDTHSATSVVSAGQSTGAQFQNTGNNYVGISFLNEATGVTNFGYVLVSNTAGTGTGLGFPATVIRTGFCNAGESVTVPAAPGAPICNAVVGGATITAGTAPGAVTIPARTLPTASATATLSFTATAASSITCATTSAGYSVAPAPLTLPAGTAASVTVTQNSATAGTFTGVVTCTAAAGATGGPFVYNFSHVVNGAPVVELARAPSLNDAGKWALIALTLGLGMFFAGRRKA
jgi:hypothetical protein